jgi:hypothetical protein
VRTRQDDEEVGVALPMGLSASPGAEEDDTRGAHVDERVRDAPDLSIEPGASLVRLGLRDRDRLGLESM